MEYTDFFYILLYKGEMASGSMNRNINLLLQFSVIFVELKLLFITHEISTDIQLNYKAFSS